MANNGSGTASHADVRVLVENAEYWLNNRGDLAMMDVTVERLRARWPHARVGIPTYRPALLRALLPTAEPISGRAGSWAREHRLRVPEVAGPRLVGPVAAGWHGVTVRPRRHVHDVRAAVRARVHSGRREARGATAAADATPPTTRVPIAVQSASLVLALGGGYLTDGDPYQAYRTLNLLEHADSLGIPTAMVGQGIGPLDDPALLARAGEVLPRIGFIGVRERRRSVGLLERLGVGSDKVLVTGDDAVEFGYRLSGKEIGSDIGVCLRVASYTGVAEGVPDTVGRAVRDFAGSVNAALVPLIISEEDAEDRRSTLPMVHGFARSREPVPRFGTAHDVAVQVSRCRLVVTGAYHAAVFALSQGIPVVGLSGSRLYDDKLHGLAQLFEGGMRVVRVDSTDLESALAGAITELWNAAPRLRDGLRASARDQVAASRAGYERVFRLVEADRPEVSAFKA
ncbi:Polysaccharide pyruvyl transferase [Rhodococcus sp. RD6.2]|uniref:polysaccharide pyruvyl transferase family protein n=1 Tax=Rhodococcus sp. RD6.2 TaxID=260936 RepID=UPI00063B3D5B|nr:polysaccharide pyruvyl transferase family protein [Rhodococcus sp. RD6.2]CRK49502.1 Polysaccharide pyruvyl transferase [Rhodococcus sp. RD6.2]